MSSIESSINQVEYSYNANAGCPIVHLFGRDKAGKFVHIEAEGFLPYFYVPANEATKSDPKRTIVDLYTDYITIKGTPVRKIFVPKPSDIREIRGGYTHFEADINLGARMMIDTGLYGGVISPGYRTHYTNLKNSDILTPIRTCMIDIECNDERGFPKAEKDEIICITCWDSFTDVYTSFIYKPFDGISIDSCTPSEPLESGCFKAQHHIIVNFNDEREMMKGFVAFITSLNPDVLSGWNFTGFDMPYINERLKALGIPVEGLGRIWGRTSPDKVKGRLVFDLLMGYKKLQRAALPSYRLDAVAEVELGEKKVRYTGTLCDLWKKTPDKLLEYNYKDVQLCVGIDKKNHVIDFYREIARYVGCPLDRTLASSQVIDTYILRKAYGKYILPSRDEAAVSEMFEGATVLTPSKGLRENVVVFDLKSLYPMIMMTINASIETKDPKGEITAPNGVHFKKEPDGLTRSLIMDLLTQRDEKKRIRNTFPHGSDEYHLYDTQQEVLKVIMNTYYGVSGFPKFRLYDREIGSAVTATGRAIIEYTKELMEEMGHKVVYGDTDSVLCELGVKSENLDDLIVKSKVIEKILNKSYDKFATDTLHVDKHYFSTKFEKVYRRFFQAGKKKRYAGHLVWKEGVMADKIDIVGFETKRSDTPVLAKKVLQDIIVMLLEGKDHAEVKAYIKDVLRNYRKGKYPLEDIGIPSGITKEFKDYKNNDIRVRSAKYSNAYLNTDFKMGSKPKRIYVRKLKGGKYPPTDVLSFEFADQIPSEFVIDYELMLNKTLKDPIVRMVESLGWTWESIDPTMSTLEMFGIG